MSDKKQNEGLDLGDLFAKFGEFLRAHGVRVFASSVTGAFTYYAGYSLTHDPLYGATLVILAEGLSLWYPFILEGAQQAFYGTWKKVNVGGLFQWLAALLGIVLAWVSIIVTDLSSATIIARDASINFGIFAVFESVPDWAQQVVVYVLPILGFSHALLLTVFYLASPEAAQARAIREIHRQANYTIKQAHADAKKSEAEAMASEYKAKAHDAAAKAGRAKANARLANEFPDMPMTANAQTTEQAKLKSDGSPNQNGGGQG